MDYFYTDANGRECGPCSDQQLRTLAQTGVIGPDTPMRTEGGHQGLAGQIPGLFPDPPGPGPGPPPPPRQLFCTNCGGSVPERAPACMSCGVKATGHKNFCRYCGNALGPEQIVCVRCGAKITSPIMPDTKQLVESVFSSANMEQIKKFAMPAIALVVALAAVVGAVWMFMFFFSGGNPLHNTKAGDWIRYNMTVIVSDDHGDHTEKATQLLEILSNDGEIVQILVTIKEAGRVVNKTMVDIDLSKSQKEIEQQMQEVFAGSGDMPALQNVDVKIDKKRTKETVIVANKKFDCIIVPSTLTATLPANAKFPNGATIPSGATITALTRTWVSRSVPITGMVKSEAKVSIRSKEKSEKFTVITILEDFGSDSLHAAAPVEVDIEENEVLEPVRLAEIRNISSVPRPPYARRDLDKIAMSQLSDLVEKELGWFAVTDNFRGEIVTVDVNLSVAVQKKDAAKYEEIVSQRSFVIAMRRDVESILRNSDSQERSEPTLGTMRNKIRVKINERLGANYVQDVICSNVRIGSM